MCPTKDNIHLFTEIVFLGNAPFKVDIVVVENVAVRITQDKSLISVCLLAPFLFAIMLTLHAARSLHVLEITG